MSKNLQRGQLVTVMHYGREYYAIVTSASSEEGVEVFMANGLRQKLEPSGCNPLPLARNVEGGAVASFNELLANAEEHQKLLAFYTELVVRLGDDRVLERIEKLVQQVERAEANAKSAWENTRTIDKARMLAEQERENWIGTAKECSDGLEFYRDLLYRIGSLFGIAAKTSDDGSVQQDVLALKVPELCSVLFDEHKRLMGHEQQANRLYTTLREGKMPEKDGTGMIDEVRAILHQRDHYRVTVDELRGQIAELEGWKQSAMQVEEMLDPVRIAHEIGLVVGNAIHPAILPWIIQSKARLHHFEQGLRDIAQEAHCIAKAGPLNTPTFEDAWKRFQDLSIKATGLLEP